MGTPVPQNVVCSDCGLPWEDHSTFADGGETWDSECIRLQREMIDGLKEKISELTDQILNRDGFPVTTVTTPNTLQPWTNGGVAPYNSGTGVPFYSSATGPVSMAPRYREDESHSISLDDAVI
jgi:hypothetical protein